MIRSELVPGKKYQWTGYSRSDKKEFLSDPTIITMLSDDGTNYIPIEIETADDWWWVDPDTLSEVSDADV